MRDLWQYVDPEKNRTATEASRDKNMPRKGQTAPPPINHDKKAISTGRTTPQVRGIHLTGNEIGHLGNGCFRVSRPGPGNQRVEICESLLPDQRSGPADGGDGIRIRGSDWDDAVSGGVFYGEHDVSAKVASVLERLRKPLPNESASTQGSNPADNGKSDDQDDAFESLEKLGNKAEWKRGDATARYVITRSLTGKLRTYAMTYDTAAEVWEAVVSVCKETLEKDG